MNIVCPYKKNISIKYPSIFVPQNIFEITWGTLQSILEEAAAFLILFQSLVGKLISVHQTYKLVRVSHRQGLQENEEEAILQP